VNNVIEKLNNYPDEIQEDDNVISTLLTNAWNAAKALEDNPGETIAFANLKNYLNQLIEEFSTPQTQIAAIITALQKNGNLTAMSESLATIAANSITDSKVDQNTINTLNADIQRLQADIKLLSDAIIALGVTNGVAITLGIVGSVVA
jgi:uncharacterized protein YaaN involved in tellurite resistance